MVHGFTLARVLKRTEKKEREEKRWEEKGKSSSCDERHYDYYGMTKCTVLSSLRSCQLVLHVKFIYTMHKIATLHHGELQSVSTKETNHLMLFIEIQYLFLL